MIKDYVDEKRILQKLAERQEAKSILSEYDEVDKGIEKMIHAYYEEAWDLPEDFVSMMENLENSGFSSRDIFALTKTLVNTSTNFIKETKKWKKDIKNNVEKIEDEIGHIAMENAKTSGITQRQLSFPVYGNVAVESRTMAVVTDRDEAIKSMANDDTLRQYLKIDETKFTKDNEAIGVAITKNGFESKDELTVKISGGTR